MGSQHPKTLLLFDNSPGFIKQCFLKAVLSCGGKNVIQNHKMRQKSYQLAGRLHLKAWNLNVEASWRGSYPRCIQSPSNGPVKYQVNMVKHHECEVEYFKPNWTQRSKICRGQVNSPQVSHSKRRIDAGEWLVASKALCTNKRPC